MKNVKEWTSLPMPGLLTMVDVVAFSSLARILGECLTIQFPTALFFLLFFLFFFEVEISSRTLILLFNTEGNEHQKVLNSTFIGLKVLYKH